jgi:protein-L-isoaspartate(D-aspartate) O-methyltransferase
MDSAKERKLMVETQIKARGIKDERVLEAMLKVPRDEFVPSRLREQAYADFPLPIGHEQTISQPYIVALMTELLELRGDEKVLEIGTGSGYQAAVLGEIAKKVISIERIKPLVKGARDVLGKYKNVKIVEGDGSKGYPKEAPYDGIIVTAAAARVPEVLIGQLAENGKIVIPVGDFLYQKLLKITKTKEGLTERHVCDVRFVPLIEG